MFIQSASIYSSKELAGVAFGVGMLYVAFVCFSRLYLHPLAKYPGPFMAKLTDWYAAYHAYKGDLHIKMREAHCYYGDVVRLGPSRLIFNTNTALHTIYKSPKVRKSKGYAALRASGSPWNIFNAIDKRIHAHKNKIMRQALTRDTMQKYEPLWMVQAQILVDRLLDRDWNSENEWSNPKNFWHYGNCMTMDIMGTVGFGRELNMQTRLDNRYMLSVIQNMQKWNSICGQSVSLAKLNLDKVFYPQQLYYGWKLLEQVRNFVEGRSKGETTSNMFSFFVNAGDSQVSTHSPLQELLADAKFLMAATGDQVSTLLASVLFYLSRNPHCYERFSNEVRDNFTTTADIRSGPTMDGCKYLHACVKESLRMSPPTGGSPWREVEAASLTIDGEVIPRGCDVGTSIYSLHHSEAYFPDSYTFRPERWLGEFPEQDQAFAKSAWCPFSLGPRACTGRVLVEMEVPDVLALIMWRTDFRVPSDPRIAKLGEGVPGDKNGRHRAHEFQLSDHITSQVDGPFLEFRARAEVEKEVC